MQFEAGNPPPELESAEWEATTLRGLRYGHLVEPASYEREETPSGLAWLHRTLADLPVGEGVDGPGYAFAPEARGSEESVLL